MHIRDRSNSVFVLTIIEDHRISDSPWFEVDLNNDDDGDRSGDGNGKE